jgi:hypothetical protein
MAAQPWEQLVREAWQVTDEADLTWMLARLRPTPPGHFTSPVRLVNSAAAWHCHQLDSGHLPYITSPHQLAAMLLQPAASSDDS